MKEAIFLSEDELLQRASAPAGRALYRASSGRTWANLVVKDHAEPLAEAHDKELDIYLVREGEATLHLGGTIVDAHTPEPGQHRGRALAGARVHRLAAGDVVFIPEGVPHLVDARDSRVVYVVVKQVVG